MNQEFPLTLTRRQLLTATAILVARRLAGAVLPPSSPRGSCRGPARSRPGGSGQARPGRRCRARFRQGAGDHHRIRLDDLPALRALLEHDLSRAEEALHRHRQGALHLARIPARSAGGGRLHAGALRRQRQIHADGRDAVRQAARLDGAEADRSRSRRSPSSSASPRKSFDECLANQKVLDSIQAVRDRAAEKLGVNSTPTFFVNGKKLTGDQSIEALAKEIDPYLKEG